MFCPECGSEYVDGIGQCVECGTSLQAVPPSRADGDLGGEPVAVFETGDQGLLVMASSMLRSADIVFMVRGEGVQDLFAYGRFPGSWSPVAGPMQILVMPSDVADTHEILAGLADRVEIPSAELGDPEPELPPVSFLWRNARSIAQVGIAVLFALMLLVILLTLSR